jgi:hypothetical protein
MDTITVTFQHGEPVGTYFGAIASKYAYKPELRKRIDELALAAQRSNNRHFVLDGEVTRAAQSTLNSALEYMRPEYVLVSIKGCGKSTHVEGTNGGMMPCGANLTMFGKSEPYYCAKCEGRI